MKKTVFLAFLLLAIACFTHFYRIDKTFIFNGDEARDVLIVKKMIDTKLPVLLGPETSVGNMYLGPLYYYLMLPALLAAHMQPVGPAIMVGVFAVITSLLIFIWGKRHFGIWGGFVAGLIYATLPIMVHYSRSSWNPNLVPFCMMLLLFAYDLRGWRGWTLLGLTAGALFQLHYVALVAVGLTGLAMLWRDHHSLKRDPLYLVLAGLGFLLITAPFWLFEARHDWVDTRAFITYLTVKQQEVSSYPSYLSRLMNNSRLIEHGIVGSETIAGRAFPAVAAIITGLLLFLFPWWFDKRKKQSEYRWLLWYLLLGTVVIASVLKESIYIHYISHLFPVIALMLGALATGALRPVRLITLGCLAYLIVWSLPILQYNLFVLSSSQIERSRTVAAYIVSHAAGRPYNIVNTQGTAVAPVEYYLALESDRPQNTLTNLVFDICEGKPCPADDETTTLLFLTGPSHPAIGDYLGHPQINEFSGKRHMESNQRVSYDTWVATIILDH